MYGFLSFFLNMNVLNIGISGVFQGEKGKEAPMRGRKCMLMERGEEEDKKEVGDVIEKKKLTKF